MEEYKYNCIECNYHNNSRTNWYHHKKSKKHTNNTNTNINTNNIYKYNCELCNYYTNKKNNWYQHTKTKKHIHNNIIEENKINIEIKERELQIKENEIKIKLKELELKEKELNKLTIINNTTSITNNTNDNSINNTINISVYNNESIESILDKESFNDMIDLIKEINDNKKPTDYYSMIKYYLYKCFIECEENKTVKYNNMRGDICKVHMGDNQWKAKSIQNILTERIEKIPNFISKISSTAPLIFNDILIPHSFDDLDNQTDEERQQIRDFKTKHKTDYKLIRDTKITMKNICENYNNNHNKKLNTIKRQHSIDIYNQ